MAQRCRYLRALPPFHDSAHHLLWWWDMRKTKLLSLIPFGGCAHEFSLPRRWPDGEYYQVCLLCGAEYRYDWKSMKRIERLPADSGMKRVAPSGRKKPTWSPRARRLRAQVELKYRG